MRTSNVDSCHLISRGGPTAGVCNRGFVGSVMITSSSISSKKYSIHGPGRSPVTTDMHIEISASQSTEKD